MFALKLAAPLSRTVASATSRSCIRPLSASVSNSRLFDESQGKALVAPVGVSGLPLLGLSSTPLSQAVRSFQTSAVQRDIDSAAKFIGAGAATVGVAGSGEFAIRERLDSLMLGQWSGRVNFYLQ
uniref:Putative atp synthase c-subunit n=1 Tax=Ixodes ricinus TaxID=34613 RepID=A0A147BVN6_IXORI